jgi:hypothetical protein
MTCQQLCRLARSGLAPVVHELTLVLLCAVLACRYEVEGMRRTVDAVLLVADHNHPHVLLLQVSQKQQQTTKTSSSSNNNRQPAQAAGAATTLAPAGAAAVAHASTAKAEVLQRLACCAALGRTSRQTWCMGSSRACPGWFSLNILRTGIGLHGVYVPVLQRSYCTDGRP